MNRHPRVLISGWYGHGNLGDEAVLAGIVQASHQTAPELALSALTVAPAETAQIAGVRGVQRRGSFRGSTRLLEGAAVLRHQLFALGGGGLLKDYGSGPGNCHIWLRPMRQAQRLRKPTMTYALGIDEIRFPESQQIVRETLEQCELVTVRDPGSLRALREIGLTREVVVTADPALLLGQPVLAQPSRRPRISITLRHWFSRGSAIENATEVERLHRELARACDALIEHHNADIHFVPFRTARGDDDREIAREVVRAMRHGDAVTPWDVSPPLAGAVAHYQQVDFVIGMRLHASILAASCGVPFIAIDYMPKVRNFVEHAGMPDALIDTAMAAEPGAVSSAIEAAFTQRQATRAHLAQRIPLLKELALLNGALLANLALADHVGARESLRSCGQIASVLGVSHA